MRGRKISWGAQSGVTDFKGAISTAAVGSAGRTTTYQDLGNVASWAPAATCGQTLYYGVASEAAAGEQWSSKEMSITWPACAASTTKLSVGVEHAVMDGSFTPGMTSDFLKAGVTWDRNGDPTAARAAGFSMIDVTAQNGGDGNCAGTVANTVSQARADAAVTKANGDNMVELCNETYLSVSAQAYGDYYDAVHKALAGTGILLGANAIWPSYCGSAYTAGGNCDWIAQIIAEVAKDNGNEPLTTAAKEIDAWTLHPYGSPVSNYDSYITSAHTDAVNAGSTAPWWITENGECINASSSQSPRPGASCFVGAVSEATQASDLTEELNDLVEAVPGDAGTPYNWVTASIWYQASDDSSGDWGMFDETCPGLCNISAERPVFTALQTWMQQHASQTNG